MKIKAHFSGVITLVLLMVFVPCYAKTDLLPGYLRTEYKESPFIDVLQPRLSWELESDVQNQYQSAYQILVASSPQLLKSNKGDFWDSGKINSNATNQIVYNGKALSSKTKVWWKVRSWDKNGEAGKWSDAATWEMGLNVKSDWKGAWIGYDLNHLGKGKVYHLPPAPYLRKDKTLKKAIKSARLYITALGLYEFYINGERIGQDYFAPGWTDYHKRVYYQTYDVTNTLRSGENAFAAVLSYGWYAGYIGYALLVGSPQVKAFYGDVPLLKAQVEVEYKDGSKEVIVTDGTWKAAEGALRESDILQGETYNAGLELNGWNNYGFNDTSWKLVSVYPDKADRMMQLYPGHPVRVISEINAKQITERQDGKYIINFGQNFSGIVHLSLKGKKGDSVVLRYGEMLHPDGSLMVENLRKARATDTYILKGDEQGEFWSPQFTYHGFQYVEVSGLKEKPAANFMKGLVLSSAIPEVGSFETDNAMLNQLYSNIVWTQRANYFDIPTDCPQRDERLGWTGDAQVYIRSAGFNNDIAAFHTKWVTDLNDSQWPSGAYPIYSPMPVNKNGESAIRSTDTYSPGWSEAGIICPYEIYKAYGDTRILRQSLPYMLKFMDFLDQKSQATFLFKEGSFKEVDPKGGFGDWLSIGRKTPPDLLATLYYGYCAKLLTEMCEALGEKELKFRFQNNLEKVKKAFMEHYSQQNGKFKTNAAAYGNGAGYVDGNLGFDGHTQTAYANAIYMQLLGHEDQKMAGYWLRELVEANNHQLTTGFLGFKPLLPALSETGNQDLAYQLLLSTEYPSLGFEVVNGATTIWERWNSYIKEKGFEHNASMNSFSHYSFGAVNEWMFQNMAGIKINEAGYRTFTIKPEIAKKGVGRVTAKYRSINGLITSSWEKKGKELHQEVTIPVNTKATLYIPSKDVKNVMVNGDALASNLNYTVKGQEEGHVIIEIGSGRYEIVSF
jgi:alpha-L-rhamnosidase